MIKKNDNIEYIDNIVRQNLEHRNKVPIGIAIEMVARLRFLFFFLIIGEIRLIVFGSLHVSVAVLGPLKGLNSPKRRL